MILTSTIIQRIKTKMNACIKNLICCNLQDFENAILLKTDVKRQPNLNEHLLQIYKLQFGVSLILYLLRVR